MTAGRYRLHLIQRRLLLGKEWMHVLYCGVLWIEGKSLYAKVALGLGILTVICIVAGDEE